MVPPRGGFSPRSSRLRGQAQLAEAKAASGVAPLDSSRHQRPSQRCAIWLRRRQRKPIWLSAAAPTLPPARSGGQVSRGAKAKRKLVGHEERLPQPVRRARAPECRFGMFASRFEGQQILRGPQARTAGSLASPSSTACRECGAARHAR